MAVATAVAVGALAVSAYGAYESSKSADKQADALEAQGDVAEQQLDFGKEQYANWKNMFYPVLGDLKTEAYKEDRPDFGAISADVDKSFDTSQAINRRTMQRYGVNPSDGGFRASETQYGLGRAMATVGANNQAREQAKDQHYNRLAGFYALGNGQQATANNTVNQGFGSVMNAYGNQANLYGNQANQYAQMAAAGANIAGRAIASMGQDNTATNYQNYDPSAGPMWAGPDSGNNPYTA